MTDTPDIEYQETQERGQAEQLYLGISNEIHRGFGIGDILKHKDSKTGFDSIVDTTKVFFKGDEAKAKEFLKEVKDSQAVTEILNHGTMQDRTIALAFLTLLSNRVAAPQDKQKALAIMLNAIDTYTTEKANNALQTLSADLKSNDLNPKDKMGRWDYARNQKSLSRLTGYAKKLLAGYTETETKIHIENQIFPVGTFSQEDFLLHKIPYVRFNGRLYAQFTAIEGNPNITSKGTDLSIHYYNTSQNPPVPHFDVNISVPSSMDAIGLDGDFTALSVKRFDLDNSQASEATLKRKGMIHPTAELQLGKDHPANKFREFREPISYGKIASAIWKLPSAEGITELSELYMIPRVKDVADSRYL